MIRLNQPCLSTVQRRRSWSSPMNLQTQANWHRCDDTGFDEADRPGVDQIPVLRLTPDRRFPRDGRCIGTNSITRLRRSIEQEAVHLEEIADRDPAWRVSGNWKLSYNTERPDSPVQRRMTNAARLRHSTVCRDPRIAVRGRLLALAVPKFMTQPTAERGLRPRRPPPFGQGRFQPRKGSAPASQATVCSSRDRSAPCAGSARSALGDGLESASREG